jgi:Tfp pilus assembly protein FimT
MRFLLKIRGFFLLELITSLLIITLLYVMLRPNFKFIDQATNARYVLSQLVAALNLARQTAMINGSTIMICLSNDEHTCTRHAHQALLVFNGELIKTSLVNNEATNLIVTPQHLMKILPLLSKPHTSELVWRSFPKNQPWLGFRANSSSTSQNGTFWYCAQPQQAPQWAVVVSQAGRWRIITGAKLVMISPPLNC